MHVFGGGGGRERMKIWEGNYHCFVWSSNASVAKVMDTVQELWESLIRLVVLIFCIIIARFSGYKEELSVLAAFHFVCYLK